ncbi:hypothetical protein JCM5350_005096 [Sporobolomyces pararoseus]
MSSTTQTTAEVATTANLIDAAPMLASQTTEQIEEDEETKKVQAESGRSLKTGDSSETETIVDEKGKAKETKLDEAHVIPKNNLPMVLLGTPETPY